MAEHSVESRRIEGRRIEGRRIEGRRIEDYAMIGDGHTAALVATDGAIEWLCLPRFDSGACLASMLGSDENGHWTNAPQERVLRVERRYRPGTLVLETDMVTDSGSVRIIDVMPHRHANPTVIRVVEGLTGEVPMHTVLRLRLDYGRAVPWVRRTPDGIRADAGPDAVVHTPVPLHGENMHTVGTFGVAAGDRIPFTLTWFHAGDEEPVACDAVDQLARAEAEWREWSEGTVTVGRWGDSVLQSLVTLKALIYEPSGGIIAAPTTSLPEQLRDHETGIIATAGCVMPASHCRRSRRTDAFPRRSPGGIGCYGRSLVIPHSYRSCTASMENDGCPNWSWTGCPDITAAGRCASEMAPPSSSSSTCTARSWTHSTRPEPLVWHPTTMPGRSNASWSSSSNSIGANPTRASGRSAAHGGTSPTPR